MAKNLNYQFDFEIGYLVTEPLFAFTMVFVIKDRRSQKQNASEPAI